VFILVVLVLLWTPYVATLLWPRAHSKRRPALVPPRQARAEPSGADLEAGSSHGPAWGALDDLQLTRLLIDSAPRTIAE
jgi:hypothetical protein